MIELSFEKLYYFPSDTVHGRVKIYSNNSSWLNKLLIRFTKSQRITIKPIDETSEALPSDKEIILSDKIIDIAENIELKAGYNIFPFSFRLHSLESSTGACKNYFDDIVTMVENNFTVEVVGIIEEEVFKTSKLVPIISLIDTKNHVDATIKEKTLLCILQKTVTFRAKTNKSWYFKGDNVLVDFCTLGRSFKKLVKDVTCSLYQTALLDTGDNIIERSKLLSTFNTVSLKNNHFILQFRLPLSLSPNINEKNFSIKTLLVFDIYLFSGSVIKAKKYLNVGYFNFDVPLVTKKIYSENYEFNDVLLEYY